MRLIISLPVKFNPLTNMRAGNGFSSLTPSWTNINILAPVMRLMVRQVEEGEEVEEVVVVVEVVMVVMVEGGTKFGTKGFVLVSPLLAVSGARLVAAGTAGAPAELRKLSEKRVSRWRPARPFSEK